MRLADRTPREQVRRRQAKAQRRHTRIVKERRNPRDLQHRRPASRTQAAPIRFKDNWVEIRERREGFLRRGLSRLNPFKGRRAMKGGGHRG